jgi:hypothetical protein
VAGQLNGQLLRIIRGIIATRNQKWSPKPIYNHLHTAIDLQTVTLSTGLAGTPVIAAMLSGLVPRDLVLRCHPRSWFYFLPWGHERMTVFSRRFHGNQE